MCEFCKKWGITETSYKEMVRSGVISTTFPAHEEIYVYYKQCLSKSSSIMEAIERVCEDKRISQRTVYNAIKQFS